MTILGAPETTEVMYGVDNIISKTVQALSEVHTCMDGCETPNPDKFNLGGITPQIQTPGGTGALGTATYFPILAGLALFLIGLKPSGIVEPQTHPNAAELNYVTNRKVRFTPGPGGQVETFEIGQGQVFFVPAGYFHYLENPDNVNGQQCSFLLW